MRGGLFTACPARRRRGYADFYAGQAWLKMPLSNAKTLITMLGEHPAFEERLRRWTHPQAWMSICYIFPDDHEGTAALTDSAQLHFPREQVGELLCAVTDNQRAGRRAR